MGKAEIISHIGNGRYNIKLKYNTAYADALRAKLTDTITKLNTSLIVLGDEVTKYDNKLALIVAELNTIIATPPIDLDRVKDLLIKQSEYSAARMKSYGWRESARVQRLSYLRRLAWLNNNVISESTTFPAWCADLTENLTGDVGTIELPNTDNTTINIRPGYSGRAEYDNSRDGIRVPLGSVSPASTFYNAAMHPGWLKWMPLYRYGTITSKDGNTCNVSLETLTDTMQGIDVVYNSPLLNVPIEYMTCNGQAFEVGDSVIVEFRGQDLNNPYVIGFKENPRSCGMVYYLKITRDDGELIDEDEGIELTIYGDDYSYLTYSEEYQTTGAYAQYWKITITGDVSGVSSCWINVETEKSVYTEYPRQYKTAERFNPSNLIVPGVYTMLIPYWDVTNITDPWPITDYKEFESISEEHLRGYLVKSSIQYKVTYKLYKDDYGDPESEHIHYTFPSYCGWMHPTICDNSLYSCLSQRCKDGVPHVPYARYRVYGDENVGEDFDYTTVGQYWGGDPCTHIAKGFLSNVTDVLEVVAPSLSGKNHTLTVKTADDMPPTTTVPCKDDWFVLSFDRIYVYGFQALCTVAVEYDY